MRTFSLHFIFYAFFSLFFAISFIVFPQHTYDASLRGLDTWWRIVFPSLLPFFIIADLMIQIGV
ncbi:MAG TPA: sporulation integral membrane protein YlbJ, partial [Massilibacterium sp.]|nr:sporulation integral membrane protein YlbJ [Massilibacterium sp.]